jgi:antitoxin CptB
MPDVTETTSTEVLRRRLRFRSWHRGTREADLLLGSFADRHLAAFDEAQLRRFEVLLEHADADLYAWFSGREPLPAELASDVAALLLSHRVTHGAPGSEG